MNRHMTVELLHPVLWAGIESVVGHDPGDVIGPSNSDISKC